MWSFDMEWRAGGGFAGHVAGMSQVSEGERPFVIEFVGPAGAGKTTLAVAAQRALQSAGYHALTWDSARGVLARRAGGGRLSRWLAWMALTGSASRARRRKQRYEALCGGMARHDELVAMLMRIARRMEGLPFSAPPCTLPWTVRRRLRHARGETEGGFDKVREVLPALMLEWWSRHFLSFVGDYHAMTARGEGGRHWHLAIDGGFVNIPMALHAYGDMSVEEMGRYARMLPAPDVVLRIQTSPATTATRFLERLRASGRDRVALPEDDQSPPSLEPFFRKCATYAACMCDSLAPRQVPVYTISNDGDLASAQAELRRALQEACGSEWRHRGSVKAGEQS